MSDIIISGNNPKNILLSSIGSFNFSSIKEVIKFQLDLGLDILTDGQIYLSRREDDSLSFISNNSLDPFLENYEIESPNSFSRCVNPLPEKSCTNNISPEKFEFVKNFLDACDIANEYLMKKKTHKQIKFIIPSPLSIFSRFAIPSDQNFDELRRNFCECMKNNIIISSIEHMISVYQEKNYQYIHWDYIQFDHPILDDFTYDDNEIHYDIKILSDIIQKINVFIKRNYENRKIFWIYYSPSNLAKRPGVIRELTDFNSISFRVTGFDDANLTDQIRQATQLSFNQICLGLINSFESKDSGGLKPYQISAKLTRILNDPNMPKNLEELVITPNIGMKGLSPIEAKRKIIAMRNGVENFKNHDQ